MQRTSIFPEKFMGQLIFKLEQPLYDKRTSPLVRWHSDLRRQLPRTPTRTHARTHVYTNTYKSNL